jgi:predicted RNA-binding Zn ribbon-like protein
MTDTTLPAPFFIADDRALDFLNTLARPWGKEIDWLNSGPNLLNWLEKAGMAPTAELARFREEIDLVECNALAAQARELREWFRSFVSIHAGQPLNLSAFAELNELNHLLAKDNNYPQIEVRNLHNQDQEVDKKETPLLWKQQRRWDSPSTLILPLAQAIGKFICQNEFKSVRRCKGPKCILWFLDVSQNHTRHWCTMAICGNRAKAAAYRIRKKHKAA